MNTKKELSIMSIDELIRLVLELREENRLLRVEINTLKEDNRLLRDDNKLLKDELARSKKSRPGQR